VAVIQDIEQPLAIATVSWVPAGEGGRRSGPPTARVYAATAVFVQGGEAEVQPGWPASADQLSVLLQRAGGDSPGGDSPGGDSPGGDSPGGDSPGGDSPYKVGFLVPDLARPFIYPGAEFLVLEGPKVVGRAVVGQTFE
jgi:hypothetical protein